MASRLSTAAIVALVVVLAACTGSAAEPTPPPGAFAPTPSIEGESTPTTATRPQPTTTIDVERAVIARVDPYTLEPLPFLIPIPMGDSFWGRSSPNGAYFAATTWNDNSGAGEIRLIDVKAWEQLGSWREWAESELSVTDDGVVYFDRAGGSTGRQLRSLQPGTSGSEVVAELPAGFYSWGSGRLVDHRFLTYGARSDPSVGLELGSIVIAETDTGEVTSIDLPGLRIGSLEPDSREPWAGYLNAAPAFLIDGGGTRVLVIQADRDIVSEVDLQTGSVTDRRFSPEGPNGAIDPTRMMLQRSTALSPDERRLYVATMQLELEVSEESWSVTMTPLGMETIDTTTWAVTSRLQEPIGEIYLAPDGETALAWGYTSIEGDSHEWTSHGLYVLAGEPMEVLAHHPPRWDDQSQGSFSFDPAAGVGYVSTWGQGRSLDVIDLGSGQVLSSSERSGYHQMFGSIGVLGVETP